MRSPTNYFVRRVVVPVVVLSFIFIVSWNWLRPGRLPGQFVDKCLSYQLKKDEPPADLLLLGTSRTGNGLDPKVIRENLTTNAISTVDKFALMGQSEVNANLAYRTYLKKRGVPRALGIELSFSRTGNVYAPFKSMFTITDRSSPLFDAITYGQYLFDQLRNGSIDADDIFAKSVFVSPVAFLFGRVNISIEQGLRHPSQVFKPLRKCGDDVLRMWSEGFSNPLLPTTEAVSDERLTKYKSIVERFSDVVFTRPRVLGEMTVIADTVRIAKESGVRDVFLYYIPSYGEARSAIALDKLRKLQPDWNILDFRPIINDPSRPTLGTQYFDANHLNTVGAYEVSRALAEFVSEVAK